jgi:FSR family fosmidomycin resistance protein-like MFS transporter
VSAPAPRTGTWVDPRLLKVTAAHFAVDCYSNAYAPLLPLLIPKLTLSLQTAGALAMIFQLAASISQLGFGRLADRWHPHRLLVLGPLVTVTGMCLVGLAPTTFWLAIVLIVAGLGSAAFHPPGAMAAYRYGGRRPGLAMSLFVGGGSIGFALAPLLFASVADRFGLEMTGLLMIPGLALCAVALRRMPMALPAAHGRPPGLRALKPYAQPIGLLYLIVVFRTIAAQSFATFVPVLLTGRGLSVTDAGAIVSMYLAACALGGFAGGPLADRFGPRSVISASLLVAVPLLMFAPLFDGLVFALLLAGGGFWLQSTQPVSVAFAQTLAPVSAATVSSIMMGVAWGTGGLLIPFIGLVADHFGISTMLTAMAAVPLLAAGCAWLLPDRRP